MNNAIDVSQSDDETPAQKKIMNLELVAPTAPEGMRVRSDDYAAAQINDAMLGAMQQVVSSGMFLRWSDNMCHFDSFLIVTLAAYCKLGSAYWEHETQERVARPISYPERRIVDLVCSFTQRSEKEMVRLRNEFMWEVLGPTGSETYGQPVDAMMHAYVADCRADEVHGVKWTYKRKHTVPCTCSDKNLVDMTSLQGCISVASEITIGERVLRAHSLEDAVWNGFRVKSCENLRCSMSVPIGSGSKLLGRCSGVYTSSVDSVQLGPILCIDLQPGFLPCIPLILSLAGYKHKLVGMVLWNGTHYRGRFLQKKVWYDYDDLGLEEMMDIKRKRGIQRHVVPTQNNNPFTLPRGWMVRGMWYVRACDASMRMVQIDPMLHCLNK